MAKALLGYMHSDPQAQVRLAAENARLRARVTELEALTLKLAQENDALAAAAAGEVLDVQNDLQPA
jgi:cell division protein FtsB